MVIRPDLLLDALHIDRLNALTRHDSEYRRFCLTYLSDSLLKKLEPDDTTQADEYAWTTFLKSNEKCGQYAIQDWYKPNSWETADEMVINELKTILYRFFTKSGDELLFGSYRELFERARQGPGAVNGQRGGSHYEKLFCGPLTATSVTLYNLYKACIHDIPYWDQADCQRSSQFGVFKQVEGSKVSFAPKTAKSSRMICKEPTLNIFFQLGLCDILVERLGSFFGIDLTTQPVVNHTLARAGSRSGDFATIDLSSASDSISIEFCRQMLPGYVFDTLMELRSPSLEYRGEKHELNMISTMGNGFTFPLQTIIFASICRAVMRVYSHRSRCETIGVFGDDIIIPSAFADVIVRYLRFFGFTPNNDKTFIEGPFRESCGADYWNGRPCRPVYLKRLKTVQDLFVALNSLNDWSAYTGISLYETCSLIHSWIPDGSFRWVPAYENYDAGFRSPSHFVPGLRWFTKDQQRLAKYEVYLPKPKYITVDVVRERILAFGPKGRMRLPYNPHGLTVSLLHGELRNSKIAVRLDRPSYRVARKVSPNWDTFLRGDFHVAKGAYVEWQQWVTAVGRNLPMPS